MPQACPPDRARPLPAGSRRLLCEVQSRRELLRRLRAEHPGVRFGAQRSWGHAPRVRTGRVGAWWWAGSQDDLCTRAREILLQLVLPLVTAQTPGCFGFPFAADVFAPRSLSVQERDALDVEDIGALLHPETTEAVAAAPPQRFRGAPMGARAPGAGGGISPAGAGRRGARVDASRRSTQVGAGRRDAHAGASAKAPGFDAGLDTWQQAAAEHECGPARILAPAGAGKTKTIVARVRTLLARGVAPESVLLLAFNRKAAEQFEERLEAQGVPTTRRLCEAHGAVHCATFNAFGARYLREIADARVHLDTNGHAQRELMSQALTDASYAIAALRPPRGSDPLGAFLATLARVRAGLEAPEALTVSVDSLGEEPVIHVPFAPVHTAYMQRQLVTGCQSFDDQVYFAVADLLAHPTRRRAMQSRFRHVLVDEFQDLNGAQLALVDVLSRPQRDLFVVGDDDQLIYGWRHADPDGILGFHERMPPRPWSATYTLGTNYRCAGSVIEASARLIVNNVRREPKTIRPRDGAPYGSVRFAGSDTWQERAAAMCAFLHTQKSRLGCDWRELAVLCRYRSQQLPVALALDQAGVPRSPALGCRLFTHPAARLLRACITLAREPHRATGEQLRRVLTQTARAVRNADLERVAAAREPWSELLTLAAAEGAVRPGPFTTLRDEASATAAALAGAPGLTSAELVWAAIDGFDLEATWDRLHEAGAPRDEAGPFEVLDALLLVAETFPDPAAYERAWDRLLADEDRDRIDNDASSAGPPSSSAVGSADPSVAGGDDRVAILTIHAAKGREYHAVVIPDYDCDLTRLEPGQLEEERRVLYVGVTRARHGILLTLDTSRPYRHPFLRELVKAPLPGEHAALTAQLIDGQKPPVAGGPERAAEEAGMVAEEAGMVAGQAEEAGMATGRAEEAGMATRKVGLTAGRAELAAGQAGMTTASPAREAGPDGRPARLRERLDEIELLFPESVPDPPHEGHVAS